MNTHVEMGFVILLLLWAWSAHAHKYIKHARGRKQAENLVSCFHGRRGKMKDGIFLNKHRDVPRAEQSFPQPYSSQQQCFRAGCSRNRTLGGKQRAAQ